MFFALRRILTNREEVEDVLRVEVPASTIAWLARKIGFSSLHFLAVSWRLVRLINFQMNADFSYSTMAKCEQ